MVFAMSVLSTRQKINLAGIIILTSITFTKTYGKKCLPKRNAWEGIGLSEKGYRPISLRYKS